MPIFNSLNNSPVKNSVAKSAIPESKAFVIKKVVAPYFDPTFHFHKEYQLFLVVEGWGTRFIGDNIKSFKAGDMVFTGPNLPHVWRSDNSYLNKKNKLKTSGLVIYFNDNFLGESILKKEEMESISHLLQRSDRGLEITGKTNKLLTRMMNELLILKGAQSIILLLKILDTMANSPDCHPITHTRYVAINKEAETDRMSKVYEYTMANFREKISLEDVAAISNMTPTSFSRYFKSRVNKSFSDFLKEIRIDHACKLLNEEKIAINSVAYECGFQTLSNFNKQFKKVKGNSPLHYKNEYLKARINTYGDF